MNINDDDRQQRHARAVNLFKSEARRQQLSAISHRQAAVAAEGNPSLEVSGHANTAEPVAGLQAVDQGTESHVLNAHFQLAAARMKAARMAATDPELARLDALVDGVAPDYSRYEPMVIEGEATEIEVTTAVAKPNPT